jgi:hypothetical protein
MDTFFLVGTPRSKIPQWERQLLALPWQKVRDSVEVKLFAQLGLRQGVQSEPIGSRAGCTA